MRQRRRTLPRTLAACLCAGVLLAGCSGTVPQTAGGGQAGSAAEQAPEPAPAGAASAPSDQGAAGQAAAGQPDEQPSRVYYQIFVRSFYDTNGDGIGDLKGITAKLDYLKELGIEGLWLTPIQPSPSYHGYDVTDYYSVNPQFGSMDDLQELLSEAHRRGIRVLMDLVVNHTSEQHPWFEDAAGGKGSQHRSWYTWAEDTGRTADAELSATGSPAWHTAGDSHYIGTFWSGMPDLNFDHPEVRQEMVRIGQFWLRQGFDGFRLDAAKHIYEDLQSSKGRPETAQSNQAWWQEFRRGLLEVKPEVYLLGEVWDSTAVVAPYLNGGFDSAFNFDLSKQLRSAAASERSVDLAASLGRIHSLYGRESEGAFVDAPFLGNHDVDRVMSALNGSVQHARMAAALLLTLPGNPFIYYGDEIGMNGRGPDENKREPMMWYAAGQGPGQTTWEPLLSNQGSPVSVEAQLQDPGSLYQHYKRLIAVRSREPALRDGAIAPFALKHPGLVAFARETGSERAAVVHNLSGAEVSAGLPADAAGLQLSFSTSEQTRLEKGTLVLPPYSTAVLK